MQFKILIIATLALFAADSVVGKKAGKPPKPGKDAALGEIQQAGGAGGKKPKVPSAVRHAMRRAVQRGGQALYAAGPPQQ